MTETSTARRPKKNTASWVIRGVLLLVIIGVAWYVLDQRRKAAEYNRAIEIFNEGRYEEAARAFESLIPRARGEIKSAAKKNLARCYVNLGENTALSLKQSAAFYRKAQEVDPESLDDTQRQAIAAAEQAPDAAPAETPDETPAP